VIALQMQVLQLQLENETAKSAVLQDAQVVFQLLKERLQVGNLNFLA